MIAEFWFFVYVLTVYRLAALIAHDTIFESIRRWIGMRAATGNKFWKLTADWMNCPFCVGVWFAIPAAILFDRIILHSHNTLIIVILWLGIAGAQYFLSCLTIDQN